MRALILGLLLAGQALAGYGADPETLEVIGDLDREECIAPNCIWWPRVEPGALQLLQRGQTHLLRWDPGRRLVRKATEAEAIENTQRMREREAAESALRAVERRQGRDELQRIRDMVQRIEEGRPAHFDRDDLLVWVARKLLER